MCRIHQMCRGRLLAPFTASEVRSPSSAARLDRRQGGRQMAQTLTTHVLPPLPYAPDALEPYIDKQTMEIHHGKHHNAYVTNLNKALEGNAELQALSIDQLLSSLDRVPENIRTTVRNNGGVHWNPSML